MLKPTEEQLTQDIRVLLVERAAVNETLTIASVQSHCKIGYARAKRLLEAAQSPAPEAQEAPTPSLEPAPPTAPVIEEVPAAPVAQQESTEIVSETVQAVEVNPIERITSVALYKGANGFISLVVGKGLVVRGELSFEEWREAHYGLFKLTKIGKLCLADSINFAKAKFGEVMVDEALHQMEFPWIDAKKAELVDQRRLPWQAREFDLEEEHFFAVGQANLRPEESAKWLEIAAEEKLTPLELKRSIEVGKTIHNEDTQSGKGKNSGIVTIYAVRALFLQWRRNNITALLAGPIDEQKDVLSELEPVCELIDKLRVNIAEAK
jgi:hypothetical protein